MPSFKHTDSTGTLSSCLLIWLSGQALHVISAAVCCCSSSSKAISHDLIHERQKYCSLIARHPGVRRMSSILQNAASQAAGKSTGPMLMTHIGKHLLGGSQVITIFFSSCSPFSSSSPSTLHSKGSGWTDFFFFSFLFFNFSFNSPLRAEWSGE